MPTEMDVTGTKTMMSQAALVGHVGEGKLCVVGRCDYEGTWQRMSAAIAKIWESPDPDFEKHNDYGCRNNGGKGSEGNEYDFFRVSGAMKNV